ncbi:MAG TPA: MucB/RseB C-terminal domain-containing protein [Ramlibacter sp.]|jgi:sigma-E factor negative regulatory protein RseB|uniref:MucB/RseB C-terminal domain-containing protein n=1 Tax=Ramlibacter sp. TaxID=1917967 RepID=UPI002D62B174|nr:MucB/RseB C-terminal domain-containing protein [Ramlibacter sp.]HZY20319.1 MucB/RseB C-terminal domain-containing protein [Ramlibacter sp.]
MAPTLLPLRSATSRWVFAMLAMGAAALAGAQQAATPVAGERGVNEWLMRMQEASRLRSYVGTFVVSSSTGSMSSARIWHAGDAGQQIERVEVLTGAPRSTFRRNDEVVTFLPEHRVVRTERREALGLFPNLLKSSDTSIPEFYGARRVGAERVAGFDADVVQLIPRDALRFGYRVWSEKRSGLVVKLQTLDAEGVVLEQAAFSELQLDAPLRADKLAQMMAPPHGWRVERSDVVKTSPAAEGWALRTAVAGFKPLSCYKRSAAAGAPAGSIHWIFSDGLASVSLFVEPFDRARHGQEGMLAAGATQTLTRRMDEWWLTVVGEVPPQTLKAFAQSLERRK